MSMFGDAERVCHLFSGSLPPGNYVRVDLVQECDVKADAQKLEETFRAGAFDLIIADPPYSLFDAARYKTPMIDRRKVLRGCAHCLAPGGFLVWLDTSYPMFRKDVFEICGFIGVVRSTNHRYRMVAIFRRK